MAGGGSHKKGEALMEDFEKLKKQGAQAVEGILACSSE
jgi:hypothetical protein